ncbi:concanavalin A-like lectin/glucanase [Gigaspora margarita]|uniref:Concanavalin A-like lectin/glucanase n=1 Tax=Gigaspora margarita TaxID=4874 RepID=A0A8H3XER4_GIGMA|nr:concanavalin A-like lectin/glucanase [Gigaspora margarita]
MERVVVREWVELISNPVTFRAKDQRVINHADLPVVKDEISITLRLKLQSHASSWATIFHKGTADLIRTPGLWLTANNSKLHPRFTGNFDHNAGIMAVGDGLSLEKWYHIAYTLSNSEKRLDVYVDGEWLGFYCIQDVKKQKVIFNDGPLYIGKAFSWGGINGDISNVRYFNWRLLAEEVKQDLIKRPIVYGSKVALLHVPTRKYLSTRGVKYDLGPNNIQYMVICSTQWMDLVNDVWTVVGAHNNDVNVGKSVSYGTVIGFKHQATEVWLHSHGKYAGSTPKSKYQQVTLCGDRNSDDDWIIRRFDSDIPNNHDHLLN